MVEAEQIRVIEPVSRAIQETIKLSNVCEHPRIPTVKLKTPGKFFLKSDPELLLHSSYSFQPQLYNSGSDWDFTSPQP